MTYNLEHWINLCDIGFLETIKHSVCCILVSLTYYKWLIQRIPGSESVSPRSETSQLTVDSDWLVQAKTCDKPKAKVTMVFTVL